MGLPGDAFIAEAMPDNAFDEVRLAKDVRQVQRAVLRAAPGRHARGQLGRGHHARLREAALPHLRAIDFDQQSHHPRKQVYLPQFFPPNNPVIEIGLRHLTETTVDQYQREERALMASRLRIGRQRYDELMDVMREDLVAPDPYVRQLARALARHYDDAVFADAVTMGDLVARSLDMLLARAEPASLKLLSGSTVADVAREVG